MFANTTVFRTTGLPSHFPIMHYVEIPQRYYPLTSRLEGILRSHGSVSCPFCSRPIQLNYQFSQNVFRMDKSSYLEKEAGVILKGVTRKSKGVTPRKLARIAIMPKNCALLQRIPHAHSRPQSPSFLGHVVGKRRALEAAVTGCQKISVIRSRMCRSYKYHCSWS